MKNEKPLTEEVKPIDSYDCYFVSPPKNCCQECAREHDPSQPHDLDSLYYNLYFKKKHGRLPTQEDAMAHCSKKVKEDYWKQKEYEKSLY